MRSVLLLPIAALVGCAANQDYLVDDNASRLDPKERAALLKLDCSQRLEEIIAARDDQSPDAERIANYRIALKAYSAAANRLAAAFTKEPDLLYASEGDALRLREQRCQSQARMVTDELRKFELAAQFKPAPAEAPAVKAPEKAEAPAPTPVKKKTKRAKAALASRKHGAHRVAVADASVDR